MAANMYQIASMTQPRLKKPKLKLDGGVMEEAVTMETLESNFEEEMKPWFNDEVETMETLDSSTELEEMPGESYEFEGVESLSLWSTSNQFQLAFCAKDLNAVDYPREHFKAFFSCGSNDEKGEYEVHKCVLLRDDEMACVDLNKLNLVDSDDDEEVACGSLYSGPVYDSDFEMDENFESELSFPLVELCTSALDYYHIKHPGDCFKLERELEEFRASSYGNTNFNLEFFSRSMTAEGKPIRKKFKAGILYLDWDKPEEFVVKNCVLVKDGEVEPNWSKVCIPTITPPEYIQEKESAKFDEFCITCLDFYKENSGECYEFVQRLTTSRGIYEGVRYVFVFHAKQPGSSEPVKFVAYAYNKRRVIHPYRCELIEDQDSVLA